MPLIKKNYNLFYFMKHLLTIAVAGLFLFASCGPSAEELAEKAKQDSLRTVFVADSIKAVEEQAAQVEQARLDSIATAEAEQLKADSIANATKK